MGPPRHLRLLKFSAFFCNAFIILASLLFEVFVVFPAIHNFGIGFYINSIFGIFICFNLLANLLACEIVDTSINSIANRPGMDSLQHATWHFCRKCSALVPPRTWHCNLCQVCILRRDHHCAFTGCCIGYKNSRYFIMFLFYAVFGCIYALLYGSIYVWWLNGHIYRNLETVGRLLFPFLLFWHFDWHNAFLFTYLMNIYFLLITATFLFINLRCFLRGATIYEYRKKCFSYDLGSFKRNLATVLGKNMYFTWLSPLVKSKLPYDGFEWVESTLQENEITIM